MTLEFSRVTLPALWTVDQAKVHLRITGTAHDADIAQKLATAQEAKHAGRLAASGRLVGGQGGLGLLAVGAGPGELAGAVPGSLVELVAQPVPLGTQLGRGQPLEIGVVGGVDG